MLSTKFGETDTMGKGGYEQAQIVVIGYGNDLRRDDGAGIALAKRIVSTWQSIGQPARLMTVTQLLPEMAQEIAGEDVRAVIFVDTSAEPNRRRIQVEEVDLDSPTSSTGHQLNAVTLLIYAALLYGKNPRAWLVTIQGHDFAHGEGFSPQVCHYLDDVVPVANQLLATVKEADPCMN